MLIGVGVLALLALIFSLIDARSAHGRWEIGVAACALAGGVLLAIWTNAKTALELGGYFGMELSGSAVRTVDFILIALIFFLACYGLCSLISGFISPLKRGEKYNNSIFRLAAFGISALVGVGFLGYFLFVTGKNMISGSGAALGSLAMIAVGAIYLLIGIGGIAQWNGRRKRISREKAEQKAVVEAVSEAIAE